MAGVNVGYALVPSGKPNLDRQRDAPSAAGRRMIRKDEGVSRGANRAFTLVSCSRGR